MPKMISTESKDEWLKLRHGNISSTEVPALFGLGSYATLFETAVLKKQPAPTEFESTVRMTWGLRLEEAIAKGISDDYGVKVRRIRRYAIHDTCRLGASADYEICGVTDVEVSDPILRQMYADLGSGVLEIKNVDRFIFKQEWKTEEGQLEAPAQFEIQTQTQLEVLNKPWAAIGVLIGGNDTQLVIRERDHEVGKAIVSKVNDFWKLLDSGGMPPVKLPEDVEIIRRLYMGSTPGKLLDAREDEEMKALCAKYREQADMQKMYEELRKSTGAKILMRIGDAEKVMVDGYSISAGTVGEVTIESYVRKPYRNMTIRAKKVETK